MHVNTFVPGDSPVGGITGLLDEESPPAKGQGGQSTWSLTLLISFAAACLAAASGTALAVSRYRVR